MEECGSKIKEALRAAGQRTVVGVFDAMDRALHQVTPKDAEGWFRHDGYLDDPPRPRPQRRGAPRSRAPRGRTLQQGSPRLASVALVTRHYPAAVRSGAPEPNANRSLLITWAGQVLAGRWGCKSWAGAEAKSYRRLTARPGWRPPVSATRPANVGRVAGDRLPCQRTGSSLQPRASTSANARGSACLNSRRACPVRKGGATSAPIRRRCRWTPASGARRNARPASRPRGAVKTSWYEGLRARTTRAPAAGGARACRLARRRGGARRPRRSRTPLETPASAGA